MATAADGVKERDGLMLLSTTHHGGGSTGRGGRAAGKGAASGQGRDGAASLSSQPRDLPNHPNSSSQPTTQEQAGLGTLTSAQWKSILELIDSPKPHDCLTGNQSWIIDTGATHHVTGTLENLREIRLIEKCTVGFPDGRTSQATHEGTSILPDGLKINNVLYVPNLACNLLSVTQLIDEFDYQVQFTSTLCVLQDRTTRRLIGVGEREDGLFFFRGVPHGKVMAIGGKDSMELWHKRLGHHSEKVLKQLPSVSK